MTGSQNYPKRVTIVEHTLREGLEAQETLVPTEAKLFIAEGLVEAGFRYLEAGYFGPTDLIPQFKDTEELLKRVPRRPDLVYMCNWSPQMAEEVIRAKKEGYGPEMVNTQIAITEPSSRLHWGISVAERWKSVTRSVELFHDAGIKVHVNVHNVWYCPFAGWTPPKVALEFTDRVFKTGCDVVRPCDPYGVVTPRQVYEHYARSLDAHPDPDLHSFHGHDYRGFQLLNCVAAMQAGCGRIDTTLGGIGGSPASIVGGVPIKKPLPYWLNIRGESGATITRTGLPSTEDFVVLCDALGIETGIDVEKVLSLGRMMERILGKKLWSVCSEAGRVPREGFLKGLNI